MKRNGANTSQSQIAGSTTSRFDQCNAGKSSRLPRSRRASVVRGNPFVSASNIEHPVVIPWDVSFAPEPGDFYQQRYKCMLNIRATIAKMPQEAYLAQNPDASLCLNLSFKLLYKLANNV